MHIPCIYHAKSYFTLKLIVMVVNNFQHANDIIYHIINKVNCVESILFSLHKFIALDDDDFEFSGCLVIPVSIYRQRNNETLHQQIQNSAI